MHRTALVDAGQTHVESLKFVRQVAIVDSHAVQDRRVEFVDMDRVLGDVVTEVIRLAVSDTRLDATASHPNGETSWMVVAAIILARQIALAVSRAPKLAPPNHKSFIQHAALLEVVD